MKLRIAKKVLWCAPNQDYVQRHRSGTVLAALKREDKTRENKEANQFWDDAMELYYNGRIRVGGYFDRPSPAEKP